MKNTWMFLMTTAVAVAQIAGGTNNVLSDEKNGYSVVMPAGWTAQQIVEAFPDDTAPRWLLRDRDAIYGDAFRHRVASMGIGEVVSSPASPWQNPYAD